MNNCKKTHIFNCFTLSNQLMLLICFLYRTQLKKLSKQKVNVPKALLS